MSTGAGALLKAYWQSKSKHDCVPDRSDIDPAEMRGLLPDIALVEILEDGTCRFRLAGTRVSRRSGMEPTGMNFSADSSEGGLKELYDLVHKTAETGQPTESEVKYFGVTPSFDQILCTALPLRRDGPEIRLVLLALEFSFSPSADFATNRLSIKRK
ncbi:PAS domain-containing protein [Minwuia sp.]|uniref:PAS domain-containing protein n=1 Tax=Minwuia sp. TaxID=2493630 RepID=UPI003A8E2023